MTTQALRSSLERQLGFLAQDNDNINLLLTISDSYRQLQEFETAQSYLERAKLLADKGFWFEQGLIYLQSKQWGYAQSAFTEARQEEDNPNIIYLLGLSYFFDEKYEECLGVINSLIEYPALLLKAKTLQHLHREEEALILLESLLDHEACADDAYGLLALMYFDQHDKLKAEHFSSIALKQNPSNYEGRLVKILLHTLKSEASIEEIEALLDLNPNDGRLLFSLGSTHMQQLNFFDAEKAFSALSELWPYFYENWLSLSWCYLMQNKLDKAEKTYRKAIGIDESISSGFGGIALTHALRNQFQEAELWLEKALSLDPQCFLAGITQIIIANQSNPLEAAQQFNTLFPSTATDINQMISQAIRTFDAGGQTIH